ncbi:MAG TPA: response regulator, partial [Aggregatilineales bacterium]|nr:response regulator [Aggregatilineales bacterium]
HQIFVLETGEIVIQRGMNLVELLKTQEHRVFSNARHDHNVTDAELQHLVESGIVAGFDDMSVWLPREIISDGIFYYFLDTKLSSAYQTMVSNLLQTTGVSDHFTSKVRMDRVAIMRSGGDPFTSLDDAESALIELRQALGEELADLSIASIHINPRADETQTLRPLNFDDLIHDTPLTTLADRCILVIEDEPEWAENLQIALETLGVEVRQASSGEMGFEILLDEEPDLVIVDLLLPDMHGYEMIAKIKKDPLTSKTPIIAMSTTSTKADVVFALHVAKVDDFLVKPIQPNVLRHKVLTLLSKRL